MFFIGKIVALATQPLVWVVLVMLLACAALVLRRPRAGLRLLILALALMAVTAWQPLPDFLLHQLEARYAEIAPDADLHAYTGVIVLGGATASGRVQQDHRQPLLNDAAERMTAPVAMLRGNPQLRILFTGGEGSLRGIGQTEAQRASIFFNTMGVPAAQVQYEDQSRNTYENAILTAQLAGVNTQDRWLLLTSANHMPRSMATFVKAGWNVTAYPVDFHTGETSDWLDFNLANGAAAWETALHEVTGLLAYRLTGRL
jgi:uncharacterized SAM-binding protein YcdF (DUF218 family)